MALDTLRRYYLSKRRYFNALGETSRAAFWRWKQEQIAWPDLPTAFPSRTKLIAEGYQTVRDLDGADEDELREIGLTKSQAAAVLVAMEQWPPMIPLIRKEYQRQDGRAAEVYDVPLIPSAARTATGVSDTIELGDLGTLRLTLAVTAVSGTNPTLDAIVQTSPDGATGWRSVFLYGQKTTTGSDPQSFSNLDRFVRCSFTIGGTLPSLTFSLLGEAC